MVIVIYLEFGIWNFHSVGMGLFLKVVRKDPSIFRAYYFEGYFAIGTEDKIPWLLGSFKRDIGIADGTFQFRWHGWPPSGLIEVLLLEISKKIKSPYSNPLPTGPCPSRGWGRQGERIGIMWGCNASVMGEVGSRPQWFGRDASKALSGGSFRFYRPSSPFRKRGPFRDFRPRQIALRGFRHKAYLAPLPNHRQK